MNCFKRSTYPLFESLALEGRQIKNLFHHQRRFERSYRSVYHSPPPFRLSDAIKGISLPGGTKRYKVRIRYNRFGTQTEILEYWPRAIHSLQLIEDHKLDYHLKWTNRESLTELYSQKGSCDDILLCSHGCLQDSSYANIALLQKGQWYTPDSPLLPGTKRALLLDKGLLTERTIRVEELEKYEGFQLMNALLKFDPNHSVPVSRIKRGVK